MTRSATPSASEYAASLAAYVAEGKEAAQKLGNRGPVRLDAEGRLAPEILDAYRRHGFYVFEGVIEPRELAELQSDMDFLLEHAPVGQGAKRDAQGRPAFGGGFEVPTYLFVAPLSDPWGGTDILNGRHPTKMTEPSPADDAPAEVVHLIQGMCQTTPSGLRVYGHPKLLAIAEAINGSDFVPYNDATFVKLPGLGGSVSWHQDGVTHWDAPNWDEGIHGFNFQVQLYGCSPENALWVVPGTHKEGRIDIVERVAANGGSELLPGAVPLFCAPGDVTVANRQILHGSFANTSPDLRVSLTFGFHRRSSVLGFTGALNQSSDQVYDEQRIFERSSVVAVAIDARAQHFPDEPRYRYQPFVGLEGEFRFGDATFERVIRNYNTKDLSI